MKNSSEICRDMGSRLFYNNLTIPLEIIGFAFSQKFLKPFTLYVYLKFHCAGKIHKSNVYSLIKEVPGFTDSRSINKHLGRLLKLNWIGYNPKSCNYFIRGFSEIRRLHGFKKRHAAVCYPKDLPKMQSFMVGAVLSKEINVQKFISVSRKRRKKAAMHKRDIALQPNSKTKVHTNYFGLSNGIIAKLLNCKQTRACELKRQATKYGYIKVRHKYKEFLKLNGSDSQLKGNLKECFPEVASRLSIRKDKKGNYKIMEQLYDEIIPLVWIKTIKKFNNMVLRRK